jgi:hypothetical protein
MSPSRKRDSALHVEKLAPSTKTEMFISAPLKKLIPQRKISGPFKKLIPQRKISAPLKKLIPLKN